MIDKNKKYCRKNTYKNTMSIKNRIKYLRKLKYNHVFNTNNISTFKKKTHVVCDQFHA
jgi:hypothetical protein